MTTIGGPATGAGTILGTLQYMSPEQVEGRTADARSDVFAFGLVLYELVTGKRVFDGASSGERDGVDSQGPAAADERAASTDAKRPRPGRADLPGERPGQAMAVGARRQTRARLDHARRRRPGSAGTCEGHDAVVAAVAGRGGRGAARSGGRIRLGESAATGRDARAGPFSGRRRPQARRSRPTWRSAPNGRQLAFTAVGGDGIIRLWVRDLTRTEPRMLAGTDGAQSAFWSPDSRYIAFGFRNQLKKIAVDGGPPQTLCEVANPVGSGAWSREGIIVFGSRGVGGLNRVAEAGGSGDSPDVARRRVLELSLVPARWAALPLFPTRPHSRQLRRIVGREARGPGCDAGLGDRRWRRLREYLEPRHGSRALRPRGNDDGPAIRRAHAHLLGRGRGHRSGRDCQSVPRVFGVGQWTARVSGWRAARKPTTDMVQPRREAAQHGRRLRERTNNSRCLPMARARPTVTSPIRSAATCG